MSDKVADAKKLFAIVTVTCGCLFGILLLTRLFLIFTRLSPNQTVPGLSIQYRMNELSGDTILAVVFAALTFIPLVVAYLYLDCQRSREARSACAGQILQKESVTEPEAGNSSEGPAPQSTPAAKPEAVKSYSNTMFVVGCLALLAGIIILIFVAIPAFMEGSTLQKP
jgi:hypothetical protein